MAAQDDRGLRALLGHFRALDRLEQLAEKEALSVNAPPPIATVRLVDRRAFFSAHGRAAQRIADSFFRTRAVLRRDDLAVEDEETDQKQQKMEKSSGKKRGGDTGSEQANKRARTGEDGTAVTAADGTEDADSLDKDAESQEEAVSCVLRPGREMASALHCVLFSERCAVQIWSSRATAAAATAASGDSGGATAVSESSALPESGIPVPVPVGGWFCSAQATPGNVKEIEDLLFGDGRQDFAQQRDVLTMSIFVGALDSANQGQRSVGVCAFNTTQRQIALCQFLDDEQLSATATLAVQSGAQECRLSEASMHKARVVQVLDRCGVAVVPLKPHFFLASVTGTPAAERATEDLARLASVDTRHVVESMFSGGTAGGEALAAAAAIVASLSLSHDANMFGKYSIVPLQLANHMHLDRAALSALNVFPDESTEYLTTMQQGGGRPAGEDALAAADGDGAEEGLGSASTSSTATTDAAVESARSSSLFGLLNQCKTPMGSRRLAQWLRLPLTNRNEIVHRQRIVSFFVRGSQSSSDASALSKIRDVHFRRVPDLDRMARRVEGMRGSLHDAWMMFKVAKMVGALGELLADSVSVDDGDEDAADERAAVGREFVEPLTACAEKLGPFMDAVTATIDVDLAEKGEYQIRSSFSEQLTELADERRQIDSELADHHSAAAKELRAQKDKVLKLENNRIHGWFFRVSKAQQRVVTQSAHKAKYPQIDQIRTDGIKFRDKKLSELNTRSSDCDKEYRAEQYKHEKVFMTTTVFDTIPLLMRVSQLLSALDTLCAFALVSARAVIPYVKPTILEDSRDGDAPQQIHLVEARHPCVEAQNALAPGVDSFVANDASLASGDGRCVIVTGPNMGGKSTYIRSIGVCVLLAQLGCFVPCAEATISVHDAILTRLGASDSQLRGVSTFMAEMLETASILESASSRSLVIVDELGRGTNTSDGFGIAWAVAETLLLQCRSLCVFATHFHEMTALAASHAGLVRNVHVSAAFAEGQLTLLYQIMPGPCDRSFGLHVAQLTDFPATIVEAATRRAKELQIAEFAGGAAAAGDSDAEFALVGGDEDVESLDQRLSRQNDARGAVLKEVEALLAVLQGANSVQDLRASFPSQVAEARARSGVLNELIDEK
jgi:DNA mismatch repair protein MSH2